MTFSANQIIAINADILANPDLNIWPKGSDGDFEIALLYNMDASPVFQVWKTNASVQDIFNAIDWTKYTPTDAPESTGIYTARAMAINVKQMNLQNMLIGRDTVNSSFTNIRAGLRDAVIQLPSGTGGAMVAAGGASGATVLTACLRNATRLEKLLSIGSATTGTITANLLGYEGQVSYFDLDIVRNS